MSVFSLSLRTLSPIHIGDGDELRQGFDFAIHEGRFYRLDENAILNRYFDRLHPDRSGNYPLPGNLLDPAKGDFANPAFFRYAISGAPRSVKDDARVKSFIKDVHDVPYIPGSSLKGALRTALAWTGWKEINPRLDREAIGRSKSWAGQPLERKLFGPNPNHDLLRALHVSDLAGPGKPGEGLTLVNAQVLTKKGAGSPIELEAVRGDVAFYGTITIDESLFGPRADGELHFDNRRRWLDDLPQRVQAHSQARIQRLAEWYEQAQNCERVAAFYRQLAAATIAPNQALVQVGWGAGWDGKTFWTHLQKDAQLFEALVRDFRMHKAGKDSSPRKPGDPFPRSRRAAMSVRNGVARAAAPLGWMLMEWEEAK